MDSWLDKFTGFMGSSLAVEKAKVIMLGVPMDFTVSFRPGARSGPQQIRAVSSGIEEYSPYLDQDLADCIYYDAGDIVLPFGNVPESLDRIKKVALALFDQQQTPIFLGGEHLITYPIIEALASKYSNLAVVHFDAHADLREDYLGEQLSHATVMRKVAGIIGPKNLYQFGIRSGTRDEFKYGRENTNFYPFKVLEPLKSCLAGLTGQPVYISLDIDVVDPAFAPGTGTPEPGGCTAAEIIEAINLMKELNVIGMDLVEVAPVLDHSDRTALLAAKIIREIILTLAK